MTAEEARFTILDSATEDAIGSWELIWVTPRETRDESLYLLFADEVERLVNEGMLEVLSHKTHSDGYPKVIFEKSKLLNEFRNHLDQDLFENFFWFHATSPKAWQEHNRLYKKIKGG